MEPGSQLTSALNKIRTQVGKKIEAHVRTQTHKNEKKKEKAEENETVFIWYEGSLK